MDQSVAHHLWLFASDHGHLRWDCGIQHNARSNLSCPVQCDHSPAPLFSGCNLVPILYDVHKLVATVHQFGPTHGRFHSNLVGF